MDGPDSNDESGVTGQYFSSSPEVASRRSSVRLDLPDRSSELVTDRGVFSSSRIDPGTKLLLMELPELPDGPVIDVGCGYGPIACTVAARQPDLAVWAVDVNDRARELCELNATTAGLSVTVTTPDAVPPELRFETVVSNPPIRIGKASLHDLMAHWLGRLTPTGSAWLVVQKHLGADSLADWMVERGHVVERIRSRQGYRILRVTPDGSDRHGAGADRADG